MNMSCRALTMRIVHSPLFPGSAVFGQHQGTNSLWQTQWRPKNPGRPIFWAGANGLEMPLAS